MFVSLIFTSVNLSFPISKMKAKYDNILFELGVGNVAFSYEVHIHWKKS